MSSDSGNKAVRKVEFALVIGVAFAVPVFTSLCHLFFYVQPYPEETLKFAVYRGLISQVVALAVLAYVLFRQGRSLSHIGLSFRWWDIPVSVLLAALAFGTKFVLLFAAVWVYYVATGHAPTSGEPVQTYFDAGLTLGTVLAMLLVPFYEELIVRAYAISELEFLTGSAFWAVAGSVVLQTVYHLYQGYFSALASAGAFLVLSMYYLKSKRALPVILAHFHMNVLALLFRSMH